MKDSFWHLAIAMLHQGVIIELSMIFIAVNLSGQSVRVSTFEKLSLMALGSTNLDWTQMNAGRISVGQSSNGKG